MKTQKSRIFVTIVLLATFATLVLATGAQPVAARRGNLGNPNPKVLPNNGHKYERLGAQWWQWALSYPVADIPFFNEGGAVDLADGQAGKTWFLAGANYGLDTPRTGEVPAGTRLFFPLANLINDYPCPPEYGFEPDPGESLEHFLQRTGNEFLDQYLPDPTELFAEVDGVPLTDLEIYRTTSSMFTFQADPALNTFFDPCITGTPQSGVSVGYYLLLAPLRPGNHTLHFGAPSWGQDITYQIKVKP